MDLITTHINTDFDGLAAMVAALRLYPGAVAALPGAEERHVRDFMKSSSWAFDIKRPGDIDLSEVERLILVDTKDRKRIGPFKKLLDTPGLEIHIYDHHPRRESDIRGSVEHIEDTGCLSAVMVELLKKKNIRISPMEATVLALGIYEETGYFSFPSIGEREFRAMAYLMKRGANLNVVKSFLDRELTREQVDLLDELLKSSREYHIGGFIINVATASREEYVPDAAIVVHKLRDITGCDALFALLRQEDRIHIIGRSRVPGVDVSKALDAFNGGGHTFAASAVVRNNSLEQTAEKLIDILEGSVRPMKAAKDIMTTPVKTLAHDLSIREAEELLSRYAFNVMPVTRNGEFAGVISREVVEKAEHHGLGNRKVSEFATTDPVTVGLDTPMFEIESVMVERNRKFLPVVEGKKVVGAITRTDLLRVLYEDILRRSRVSDETLRKRLAPGRNLRSLMAEKFPEERFKLLRLCGRVAEQMSFNSYLVGGSVRDMLRNESNLDFDVVVEGDGIAFAEELVRQTGGRVRSHRRFNTAVIVLPDGFKLDVATARTEYYESPAVLPTVEASSIKKDLYRRDFTINTLAVRLDGDRFGNLIDFFGGQRDLKDRTIRILHNLSFVEDPTRAFRAIRFSERFGFRIGKHTANLMKTAVKMKLFSKLSGSRIFEELRLLFRETKPASSLKALDEFRLLGVIHPSIRFSENLGGLMDSVEKVIEWYRLLYMKEPLDESAVYLMALFTGLTGEEVDQALKRLQAPPRTQRRIRRGHMHVKAILRRVENPAPAYIFHALGEFDLEALVLAMAKAGDENAEKCLSSYITDIRHTAPLLTGKELEAMGYPPGPVYQRIFQELLEARLEGRVKTKYDETLLVRERFRPGTADINRDATDIDAT